VHGEIGEVEKLPPAVRILGRQVGEGGERLLGRVVAGIGGDGGEALAQRVVDAAEADNAGGASVAHHLKTVIPRGGELEREFRFGPDDAADVAMFGRLPIAPTSTAEWIFT